MGVRVRVRVRAGGRKNMLARDPPPQKKMVAAVARKTRGVNPARPVGAALTCNSAVSWQHVAWAMEG